MYIEKWYEKTWVIALFLIFAFPIGVFLMWSQKYDWEKRRKYEISIIGGLLFVFISIIMFGGKETENEVTNTQTRKTTISTYNQKEEAKTEDKLEVKTEEEFDIKSKWNNDGTFKLDAEPNTSAAVDEIVLMAKEHSPNATDIEIKEAVKFINENYNNYWTDNSLMEKTMYYGALLEYSNKNKDIKNLGTDTVQVVKYVYRKAEKVEDSSTQSNLIQIKKSLDKIPDDYKK